MRLQFAFIVLVCLAEIPVFGQADRRTFQDDTVRINRLIRTTINTIGPDISQAEEFAREALALSEEINYSKGRIESSLALAEIHMTRGAYAPAELLLQTGIVLSEETGDDASLAKCCLQMYSFLRVKGEYDNAASFNERAGELGAILANKEILASYYLNEGLIKGVGGDRAAGIKYALQALEMFRALKREHQVGNTLGAIGYMFELAGSYEKAMDYQRQALEVHLRLNNHSRAGWAYLNIGVVYSRRSNDALALAYYKKALELAEKGEDLRLTLACLDNIGGKYSLNGDFSNAGAYLNRAYRLSTASGHNSRTVYITGNLAENYLYMGKYDSAELFGLENLRIATQERNAFEKRQASLVLSRIYAAQNRHAEAYEMLLEHVALTDSTFNEEKSRQIEEVREAFETEAKEQEIVNLTALNENVRLKNRTYAGAAIGALILGGLLFYVQRVKVKRNRLLVEKGQEVDRMKSRFFTNISHEFRTPLTLILGPIPGILARTEDPATRNQLTVMNKNAGRLLELINQLLELSKIESGSVVLQVSRSDVVTVLKGVTLSFHSITEQRGIDLVMDVSPEKLEVNFDRSKFETVLTNLLANAFKFTPPEGQITVTSRLVQRMMKKSRREFIEISVTDTGSGIPEEDIGNIFNRFYQSDNSQLLQQEGSGIGLALSKEFVELHGGSIQAFSRMGKGTTVVFDIPVDIPDSDAVVDEVGEKRYTMVTIGEGNGEEPGRDEDTTHLETKPMVLVVEDHPEVLDYIREILKEGYAVLTARDGEEGIAKAMETIPDLIISDVMMPMKDGYEVSRTLKGDERTSHIPIILLTARSGSNDRIGGLKSQADDYVTKPFVPAELLARVENLIESRKRLKEKYKKESTLKPSEIAENSIDEKFLQKLVDIVEREIGNEHFGVEQLSQEIGMSRSQLHRKLKALLDQGPNQFIRTFRLKRAHDLLKQRAATTSEIAYRVGFSSPSYFTKCFQEHFGYVPTDLLR